MKVIALGMGMQSTALYLMSSMRQFERADVAIFSDPMSEHPETYKLVDWLLKWEKECADAIPIHIVKKDLYDDIVTPIKKMKTGYDKYACIPSFTKNENGETGISRRQCTYDYKIAPLHKKVRQLMGLKSGERLIPYELWLGITIDEAQRMKDNRDKKIKNYYPFIEMMMSRSDCMNYMRDNGFPIPVKSACVFCPYHSDSFWLELKKENGTAWKTALKVDKIIRSRENTTIKDKMYLHPSCVPLEDVYLKEDQLDMFGNECEGHCGL